MPKEQDAREKLDTHNRQVKNLTTVFQCLTSAMKDYENEKKELHKARPTKLQTCLTGCLLVLWGRAHLTCV